jgi:hypothetical protein
VRVQLLALGAGLLVAAPGTVSYAAEEAKPEDKGFFEQLGEDIVEGATGLKEQAAAAVPDVPSGAVVAFNRDKCPLGWRSFPPAAGRVIRGTGDSGDGRPVGRMEIGEKELVEGGDDVMVGLPWVGLLICEKE